jgi:hypothetical protein
MNRPQYRVRQIDGVIAAPRAIRFEPAMIDGKPVRVQGNLEFTFNLY